jgi:hypothetical protein
MRLPSQTPDTAALNNLANSDRMSNLGVDLLLVDRQQADRPLGALRHGDLRLNPDSAG